MHQTRTNRLFKSLLLGLHAPEPGHSPKVTPRQLTRPWQRQLLHLHWVSMQFETVNEL